MALAIVLFVVYFCFVSCLFADGKQPIVELEINPTVEDDEVVELKPVSDEEINALFELAFSLNKPLTPINEDQPQLLTSTNENLPNLPNWGIRDFKKWGLQWNKQNPENRIKAIANLTKPQWEEIYLELAT